jgi:hypothetical protein
VTEKLGEQGSKRWRETTLGECPGRLRERYIPVPESCWEASSHMEFSPDSEPPKSQSPGREPRISTWKSILVISCVDRYGYHQGSKWAVRECG